MSCAKELQEEEREVLDSIYEGDEAFKKLDPNTFQYKFGKDGDCKSLLLEIHWTPEYPDNVPVINLDTFYNKHIQEATKQNIIKRIHEEAQQFLGCAMTYSLFEYVKENVDEFLKDQLEFQQLQNVIEEPNKTEIFSQESSSKKTDKKEHLTKAQKRRQWDRMDSKGERPRGWDWVDIVKHLSQTGSKEPESNS